MKRLALVLVAIISTALLVPNGLGAQGIAEEQHCTAKVDAERRTVAEYRCFSSFSEAISHATIGQVRLSPEAKPTRLASETFVGLQAQTVIGIDYESPGYSCER